MVLPGGGLSRWGSLPGRWAWVGPELWVGRAECGKKNAGMQKGARRGWTRMANEKSGGTGATAVSLCLTCALLSARWGRCPEPGCFWSYWSLSELSSWIDFTSKPFGTLREPAGADPGLTWQLD